MTDGAGRRIGAAVDLGSNSVHLLVAAIDDHRLDPVVDESVFLGLGRTVDGQGVLGSAARSDLVATLGRYAEIARAHGAAGLIALGTEPMRRAADAAAAVHDVAVRVGVPIHVVSHEEEALLTLLGVTGGRPVEDELLVVDVGGGSSEFCLIGPGRQPIARGIRLGSARLTEVFVRHDPPTPDEIAAMREAADGPLGDVPEGHPARIVVVGGTASNLAKVVGPAVSPAGVLTLAGIAAAVAAVVTGPAADAAERHAIRPDRARVLPAGAAILEAILARYGRDRLVVSEASLREGAVRAVAHAGDGWRDRLSTLALGWR